MRKNFFNDVVYDFVVRKESKYFSNTIDYLTQQNYAKKQIIKILKADIKKILYKIGNKQKDYALKELIINLRGADLHYVAKYIYKYYK